MIKNIIVIGMMFVSASAFAGSSSNGRSDEYSTKSSACMIPLHTSDQIQFINVNMIRTVSIKKHDEETVRIHYAANTSDNYLKIEYKTKEDAINATNKIINMINNCGKKD